MGHTKGWRWMYCNFTIVPVNRLLYQLLDMIIHSDSTNVVNSIKYTCSGLSKIIQYNFDADERFQRFFVETYTTAKGRMDVQQNTVVNHTFQRVQTYDRTFEWAVEGMQTTETR